MEVLVVGLSLDWFADRHIGKDVWVVGSDASLSGFGPEFFVGRTVIGVNTVCRLVPVTYTVTKADWNHKTGWLDEQVAWRPDIPTVCSRHEQGIYAYPQVTTPGVTLFDHIDNPSHAFSAQAHIPTDGKLLVSQTTGGTALHLAALMGARTVFVIGMSGGTFGGRRNGDGYVSPGATPTSNGKTVEIGAEQMQAIADRLTGLYGCEFVSVLPWANLRLGGTRFESPFGRLN